MTNGEKFKEVFGFRPREVCIMPFLICKEQDSCEVCLFQNFWDKEYKHCFRIKEEYENEN